MRSSLISSRKIFLVAVSVFLLAGCSTIDRMFQSGAKTEPPSAPASETVKKEELTPKVQPDAPAVVPAEQPQPPPPPPPLPPAPPQIQKPAPAPVLRVAEIVWSSVNLREGPGTNHKISGSARKGSSVSILEDNGQWLRVRLEDGKEAWVYKSATSVAPKAPPASAPVSSPAKPKPM